MNIDLLRRKLTLAARSWTEDDSVPYAFEQRILASVREGRRLPPHTGVEWAAGLWRAAISCVALAVILGTCSISFPAEPSGVEDLGVALENAILAAADEALEVP